MFKIKNKNCNLNFGIIVDNNINEDKLCMTLVNNLLIENITKSPTNLSSRAVCHNGTILNTVLQNTL
jgi:hypothetical protein